MVLVTELLLQRTRASSVACFYPTILSRYADPVSITSLSHESIERDLQPLGFHARRAASLHAIAAALASIPGGDVPRSENEVLSLPGIGRYMARAVLCFAFGHPVSIVDANVTRVFSRFFDLESTGDNRRNPHLWEKGDEILSTNPARAKDINWAILDLAALACLPRKPACDQCPLLERCARVQGSS